MINFGKSAVLVRDSPTNTLKGYHDRISSKYTFQLWFRIWHFELKDVGFHFNSSQCKKKKKKDTKIIPTENDTLGKIKVFWFLDFSYQNHTLDRISENWYGPWESVIEAGKPD